MGAVTGMLGLGGGSPGAKLADLSNPVEAGQIKNAYTGVQNGMEGQQNLLNALQGQNGLQNQSNVYGQMQNVANGTGPNPAQAMLSQATGQNVANQAALMAGQRGASANAGMMARQAGQAGGNLQQQAAGQGAVMQANQQLGALGQMGNMANQMAGQQIGQTNANVASQQGEQNQLLGAQQGFNNAQIQNQANVNQANAALQQQQQGIGGKLVSGALNAMGAGIPGLVSGLFSGGGGAAPAPSTLGGGGGGNAPAGRAVMSPFAGGGEVQQQPQQAQAQPLQPFGPMSSFAKIIHGQNQAVATPQPMQQQPPMMAQGGPVPALVSPGEKYLPPQAVQQVAKGANPMQVGETIPGKPKVEGAKNSYANDTVPKTLEEGGIVLPRSVTQHKHPQWAAHKFVSAILAKQGKGLK